MPFLVVVLLLLVDAGALGALRQKALVALRSAAFLRVGTPRAAIEPEVGAHEWSFMAEEGRLPAEAGAGIAAHATGIIGRGLDALGGPRTYRLGIRPDVPYPLLVPDGERRTGLYMDDAFWSYPEVGNVYLHALRQAPPFSVIARWLLKSDEE